MCFCEVITVNQSHTCDLVNKLWFGFILNNREERILKKKSVSQLIADKSISRHASSWLFLAWLRLPSTLNCDSTFDLWCTDLCFEVVRAPDSCSKGRGFKSRQEPMSNFMCWLLFQYPFHPCLTAVARNRSWSFCQKCRWQIRVKHACTLRVWLCMKWRDMVHGCMVYTELAETAVVSRGTSHVTTKQRCKHTTHVDIENTL